MKVVDTTRIMRQSRRSSQPEFPFSFFEYSCLCRGVVVRVRVCKLPPYMFDVWIDGYYQDALSSNLLAFSSFSRSINYAYCKLLAYGYDFDDLRLESVRLRAEEDLNNCKTQKISV